MSTDAGPLGEPSISPSPQAKAMVERINRLAVAIADRWLLWTLALLSTTSGLATVAPLLRTSGFDVVADSIYASFHVICHQQADRSFHPFGEQMACCQRDIAIFAGGLLTAAAFGLLRRRGRAVSMHHAVALLLIAPIAIDGVTQLVGLHESSWQLRVGTGGLFAFGVAGVALPYLERAFTRVVHDCRAGIA